MHLARRHMHHLHMRCQYKVPQGCTGCSASLPLWRGNHRRLDSRHGIQLGRTFRRGWRTLQQHSGVSSGSASAGCRRMRRCRTCRVGTWSEECCGQQVQWAGCVEHGMPCEMGGFCGRHLECCRPQVSDSRAYRDRGHRGPSGSRPLQLDLRKPSEDP